MAGVTLKSNEHQIDLEIPVIGTSFEEKMALRIESSIRPNRFNRLMMVEITDCTGEVYKVSTSNISFKGMAIIGQTPLEPGEDVKVKIGNSGFHSATVVWRRERKIGLNFDQEIDLIASLGLLLDVQQVKVSKNSN
jgi:hypothetical protein